jgi:hypothetical protein
MRGAAETDVSVMDPYHAEWRILREQPHNVLLEGPVAATDAILRLLRPHIREPIVWAGAHAPLDLPSGNTPEFVLRDVAALTVPDQRRLREWLAGTGSNTRLISTTERPLFGLVVGRHFDAALYYRLNVMLLHVGPRNPPGLPDDDATGVQRRIESTSASRPYRSPESGGFDGRQEHGH